MWRLPPRLRGDNLHRPCFLRQNQVEVCFQVTQLHAGSVTPSTWTWALSATWAVQGSTLRSSLPCTSQLGSSTGLGKPPSTGLPWQPAFLHQVETSKQEFIQLQRNRTESVNATRRRYISSSKEQQELLTARKKVILPYLFWNIEFIWESPTETYQEDELTYNALEKDIAVVNLFFGDSTVQGNILIFSSSM